MSKERNAERRRLEEARRDGRNWRFWGPYLSERQWGTVREDYSQNGNAWDYFPHDHARSRAYRWGEDGLAGFSDEQSRLCFCIGLWNGADPILKERLFGLTNSEGNHGEDVKEYYFYLDNTPTHSYMKYLYKYPQAAFPYADLVRTNRARSRHEMEYELIDTGVFEGNRYFDVCLEYAKADPDDILIRIIAHNRGPEPAPLHLLPQFWFRDVWSWGGGPRPELRAAPGPAGIRVVLASHSELGERAITYQGDVPVLFTENATNTERLWHQPNAAAFVKDAFHEYVIGGRTDKVNPAGTGTKVAAHYQRLVPPGQSWEVRLRFSHAAATPDALGEAFSAVFRDRIAEADEFYQSITPDTLDDDQAMVMRQALAGMLWTKQHYFFDLDRWLEDRGSHPLHPVRRGHPRNQQWFHMLNNDVISMPDKWEYPWYAAWDLAFHTSALSMVDLDFAKDQLDLMLREPYLHPNGQLPAYEWNFSDVNPPVHAWAALYLFTMERELRGRGDISFLKHAFHKLMLNFTWWVNRKDPTGRNAFEGGFLGLDNIGVFDRSSTLPTGGHLEQADGTAWMALFCQNMLEIAMELASDDPTYEHVMSKFVEHFFWIASAMDRVGDHHDEMWDPQDGFFYDLLRLPDGRATRLKVRSLVGLLPLCATTVIPAELLARFPQTMARARQFLERHPELSVNTHDPQQPGLRGRRLLAVCSEQKLRRILSRMLDENEFLSPYGIRSLSRYHLDHPYTFRVHGEDYVVRYLPAESDSGMFGGNSNWRGPVWFPLNMLLLRALLQFYAYYGDRFTVDCPTGSGQQMTLFEVARELANRLARIFLRDAGGRRAVFGGNEYFQTDPHWKDYLLFYEYFHGDNGAGIGASHQTGWTGIVARTLQLFGHLKPENILEGTIARPLTAAYREN